MTDKRNGYSLEIDLMPIIEGKVDVPNYEEMPLNIAISHAAAFGSLHSGRVHFAGTDKWSNRRAVIALETSPYGGSYYGSGIVLWEANYPDYGKAGRFAICKHEKVDDPGADHRRGWHPGACSKCGLNMTVDSGD